MPNLLKAALNILVEIGQVTACAIVVALPLVLISRAVCHRKKRRAVRTYAKRVSRLLRERYGRQERYTPAQVKGMLKEWGYSTNYDCYALAMYCSHDDFVNYHRTVGESCDYHSMRSEISDFFDSVFQSDSAFDACDVIDLGDRSNSTDTGDRSSWWSDLFDSGSSNDFSGDSSYESDFGGGNDFSSDSGGDSDSGGGGSD